jgi:hypothetical protein
VVAILPGDAGGRRRQGGEVSELEVLWLLWNSSPELRSGSARSGRSGSRQPGPREIKWACQGGVHSQGKPSSEDRRARGGVVLPGASESSGDSGGLGEKFLQPGGPISRRGRERRERRTRGTYRRGLDGHYSREINGGVLLWRPFPETEREKEDCGRRVKTCGVHCR